MRFAVICFMGQTMQKATLFSVQQTGEIADLVKSMTAQSQTMGDEKQSRVVDMEAQHSHPAHGVHAESTPRPCFEISFGYAWRLPYRWSIGLARYSDGLVITPLRFPGRGSSLPF